VPGDLRLQRLCGLGHRVPALVFIFERVDFLAKRDSSALHLLLLQQFVALAQLILKRSYRPLFRRASSAT
jgi:hypothetical protein